MKESKMTTDDLARMVNSGFNTVQKDIQGMRQEMNCRLGNVENVVKKLENGQEDIKLRLDNVAYRFEFVELKRRVTLLERKAGFAK